VKIRLEHPKYLHIQKIDGELYVYGDEKKRFELKTLDQLNNDCYIGQQNISIRVSSLFSKPVID
jgi:hypothetical protein